jgi:hypothetical protein
MSEYEIFNNDEEIKIVPETKKPKKEKKVVSQKTASEKTESSFVKFLKQAFSLYYLPLTLSIFTILFAFLSKFILIFAVTPGGFAAAASFFFIGFACVFASLLLELMYIIKTSRLEFNLKILFILASLFVLFI